MDITTLFTTAFLVGFSGAMMPGPLLTMTISESARRGFIAGPLIVLGHAILELLLILALIAGLSSLLASPVVTKIIAVLGGIVLIYFGSSMGWAAARRGSEINMDLDSNQTNPKSMHPILAGIVISIANPYWIIWWATIGLAYVTIALNIGKLGLASFFTGHILADLVWYSVIAALVSGSRKFLTAKLYQHIILLCGLFLIGLGIYFIYSIL